MTAIDLCCGAGGLSSGLIRAGIEVILGVDIWRDALDVYGRNLHVQTLRWDLSEVPDLPRVDLVVGGPPCTDFSRNGLRKEGRRARSTLSFAFAVGRHKPRYFAMENVPEARKSVAYGQGANYLRTQGYGLSEVVVESCRFGVPQVRRRLLVVGELGGRDDAHRELLLAGASEQRMTVREYCGSRFRGEYIYSHLGKKRRIRTVDEPCYAIRTMPDRMPRNYRGQPNDATGDLSCVRSLTVREAAMIQSFPDDWDWDGIRLRDAWKMVGNAVPPLLGEHLGRALLAASGGRCQQQSLIGPAGGTRTNDG